MKKRAAPYLSAVSVIFAFLLSLLAACARDTGLLSRPCARDTDVYTLLDAALASQGEAPAGTVYSSALPEGDPARLDDDLAAVLWGDGSAHPAYALTSSAAIFLSSKKMPFEIAVLECVSTDSTQDVALMCCRRADALAREFPDTENRFSISVSGRYVIAAFCPSPEAAQKAASAKLGN